MSDLVERGKVSSGSAITEVMGTLWDDDRKPSIAGWQRGRDKGIELSGLLKAQSFQTDSEDLNDLPLSVVDTAAVQHLKKKKEMRKKKIHFRLSKGKRMEDGE